MLFKSGIASTMLGKSIKFFQRWIQQKAGIRLPSQERGSVISLRLWMIYNSAIAFFFQSFLFFKSWVGLCSTEWLHFEIPMMTLMTFMNGCFWIRQWIQEHPLINVIFIYGYCSIHTYRNVMLNSLYLNFLSVYLAD